MTRTKLQPGDTTTLHGVTLKIVKRAGLVVLLELDGQTMDVGWRSPLEVGGKIVRLYPTATGGVRVLSDEEL